MVNMTVTEFINALGTGVTDITYDTTKAEGVVVDGTTANVYNVAISGAFGGSGSRMPGTLVNADLRGLDTSGVTSMYEMFYYCTSLISANLSNFNTSNVTSMKYMFYNCYYLKSIDLSSFSTINVIDMFDMFFSCRSATTINVSSFDIRNVRNIQGMFHNCSSLTTIDVSSFDTSNLLSLNDLFNGCAKLTSIDLSNFDTSNAISTSRLFCYCTKLKSIDLSSFNTSTITDSSNMFLSCSNASVIINPETWTLDKTPTAYGGTNLTFYKNDEFIENTIVAKNIELVSRAIDGSINATKFIGDGSELTGVASSDVIKIATSPTDKTTLWIDNTNEGTFSVPEINDNAINNYDTWSSQKIKAEFDKLYAIINSLTDTSSTSDNTESNTEESTNNTSEEIV